MITKICVCCAKHPVKYWVVEPVCKVAIAMNNLGTELTVCQPSRSTKIATIMISVARSLISTIRHQSILQQLEPIHQVILWVVFLDQLLLQIKTTLCPCSNTISFKALDQELNFPIALAEIQLYNSSKIWVASWVGSKNSHLKQPTYPTHPLWIHSYLHRCGT